MKLISFVPRQTTPQTMAKGKPGTVYVHGSEPPYTRTYQAIIPTAKEEVAKFARITRYAPASDELYHALAMAGEWIDNIIEVVGVDQAINSMPNNCGGRLQIRGALENARELDLLK